MVRGSLAKHSWKQGCFCLLKFNTLDAPQCTENVVFIAMAFKILI